MECPRPIKSCLCRVYATWSSRTRPSMRIQRSEGLGSRLCSDTGHLVPNAERATPRFSKAARVATVLQLVSNVSVFAVKQPYI